MITNRIFLSLFVSILITLFGCKSPKGIELSYSDTNGNLVIYKIKNNDFYCITSNDEKIIAPVYGVEFNGGELLLNNYLDSVYYNNPTYNFIDYNIIEFYYLLFDKDLKIKEVRTLNLHKRPDDYNNVRCKINMVLEDALQNTEGHWIKKIPDKKWYVYIHRHLIR